MKLCRLHGHKNRRIDILKIDIEGGEFSTLTPLFISGKWKELPLIRQVI
jgi:hypothetical protein